MAGHDRIRCVEVVDGLGNKHTREFREIYSIWGALRSVGLPNPPTPWGRINDKGVKTCCAETRGDGWHRGSCDNAGRLHTDGRYYCKTHNPDNIKAKSDARSKAWREKWDAEKAAAELKDKRNTFRKAAAEAILKIAAGHNDALALAREVAVLNPDAPT